MSCFLFISIDLISNSTITSPSASSDKVIQRLKGNLAFSTCSKRLFEKLNVDLLI